MGQLLLNATLRDPSCSHNTQRWPMDWPHTLVFPIVFTLFLTRVEEKRGKKLRQGKETLNRLLLQLLNHTSCKVSTKRENTCLPAVLTSCSHCLTTTNHHSAGHERLEQKLKWTLPFLLPWEPLSHERLAGKQTLWPSRVRQKEPPKIKIFFNSKNPKREHIDLTMNNQYRLFSSIHCVKNLFLPVHQGDFFPSLLCCFLPFYLCIVPVFTLPWQEKLLQTLITFPALFSLKTTTVFPNACQRASELDSVYMCACLHSLWTGPGSSLLKMLAPDPPDSCQEISKHAI